jgi:hypothetical protein
MTAMEFTQKKLSGPNESHPLYACLPANGTSAAIVLPFNFLSFHLPNIRFSMDIHFLLRKDFADPQRDQSGMQYYCPDCAFPLGILSDPEWILKGYRPCPALYIQKNT